MVFHFIGADGIGMSAIAEVLLKLGYKVQGSNDVDGENIEHLKKLGAKVFIGHKPENINNANFVVYSSAIPENNVEIMEAKKNNIPLIERACMLQSLFALKKAIAITGTHGKTTTTSFVGTMLDVAGLKPTVIDGGIMNKYNSHNIVGDGDWVVAESCEAFGNIKHYTADIAVVTNIDAEHMEYYKTFDNLKNYFREFLNRVPSNGLVVACADHPIALELANEVKTKKKVITYGFDKNADIYADNIKFDIDGSYFTAYFKDGKKLDLHLPLFGKHNILNSLVAISIAKFLNITDEKIIEAVKEFTGTKHRFTRVGTVNDITIFDDYGHHPKEIETTLAMTRTIAKNNKIFAIFQPHRYSRLTNLFDDFLKCFKDADYIICMPVYGAGESETGFKNHTDFFEELSKNTDKKVFKINNFSEIKEIILSNAKSNDIIVSLGAGSIKHYIYELPEMLKK